MSDAPRAPAETVDDGGARVLVVGCGGLGSPASRALAASPRVKRITLLDDDRVDVTKLHRQTLYRDADVGRDKADAAAASLRHDARPGLEIVARRGGIGLVAPHVGVAVERLAVQVRHVHPVVVQERDAFHPRRRRQRAARR